MIDKRERERGRWYCYFSITYHNEIGSWIQSCPPTTGRLFPFLATSQNSMETPIGANMEAMKSSSRTRDGKVKYEDSRNNMRLKPIVGVAFFSSFLHILLMVVGKLNKTAIICQLLYFRIPLSLAIHYWLYWEVKLFCHL